MAGWDDDGGRAVAGVGRWALHCQGQEGNGVRLKRDVTINMLLGGACGKAGGGGGTVSATVDFVG